MFNRLFLFAFVATASAATAEEWNLRSTDIPLTVPQVSALTAGKTLKFYDEGQSKFSVGGAYSYTYADDGGTAFGRFSIKKDGQVCIDFDNGHQRCDLYVKSGGLLMMITEQGDRFPIRMSFSVRP